MKAEVVFEKKFCNIQGKEYEYDHSYPLPGELSPPVNEKWLCLGQGFVCKSEYYYSDGTKKTSEDKGNENYIFWKKLS